jgi:hypothetical protein
MKKLLDELILTRDTNSLELILPNIHRAGFLISGLLNHLMTSFSVVSTTKCHSFLVCSQLRAAERNFL